MVSCGCSQGNQASSSFFHHINSDFLLVSERSILTLKKKALRRTKTLRKDTETQQPIKPSRFTAYLNKFKAPFTREFWEDAFEPSNGEKLVDSKVLSYAYIEAGSIETIGA